MSKSFEEQMEELEEIVEELEKGELSLEDSVSNLNKELKSQKSVIRH